MHQALLLRAMHALSHLILIIVSSSITPILQMKELMFTEVKLIYGKTEIWAKVRVQTLQYWNFFYSICQSDYFWEIELLISPEENRGNFWR